MGWFVVVILWVASYIIQRLTTPKPDAPRARPAGEFSKPTAEAGRPIPVPFGTCKVDGTNCLWYGGIAAAAIREGDATIGYKYFITVQLGVCIGPVDAVLDIQWNGKTGPSIPSLPRNGPGPAELTYNLPRLFGTDPDDGIGDTLAVYFGSQDQDPDPFLEGILERNMPGYPGLCYLVLRNFYVGNSGSLPDISVVVRRCPNSLGLSGGLENIAGDANPACIIYEILTGDPGPGARGPAWGLGISSGMIDLAAFRAAGAYLADEGFGLSFLIDSQKPGDEWIAEICRHIDAVVFTDLFTGLITIRLARFDYDPGSLPVLNEDCFDSLEMNRRGPQETMNVIRLRFTNRALNFKEDVVQAHDIANRAMQGGQWAPVSLDFFGISNATLAAKVAERERSTLTYPFAALTAVANRKAWGLQPGSLFRLDYAPLGIFGMTVRVGQVRSGTLTDGRMHLELTEDIFSVSWTTFVPPPPSGWENPLRIPGPPAAQAFHGAPFEFARSSWDPSQMPRGLTLLARDPADFVSGYNIHRLSGSAWLDPIKADAVTPLGSIPEATGPAAEEIWVEPVVDLSAVRLGGGEKSLSGLSLAILVPPADQVPGSAGRGSEVIAYESITQTTPGRYLLAGCRRGVLDTVPRSLPEGTQVWFVSFGFGLISCERPTAGAPHTDLQVKLAPMNSAGEWPDWESGQLETLEFDRYDATRTTAREDLAYCATAFKICGWEFPSNISGALGLAWLHRNRYGVWTLADRGRTDEIENGWAYHLCVRGEDEQVLILDEDFSGTSFGLSLEDEIGLAGHLQWRFRVTLETALPKTGPTDVLHAWQGFDITVECSGWGVNYGHYYGGAIGRDDPA
jgi:hypothetical protein